MVFFGVMLTPSMMIARVIANLKNSLRDRLLFGRIAALTFSTWFWRDAATIQI
jgi:hypothetical protein